MPTILGQNQYGKAETRVVRIVRDGDTHHIKDLSVSVALSGDMDEVHYSGSNAKVLPTDTAKNTVYAFAGKYGVDSAEQFGIHLARHFVTSQDAIHRARIRIEEYAWKRIATPGAGSRSRSPGAGRARHSFVRKGQEIRLAQVGYDGDAWQILSGLKDLSVLNSTNSEFRGYVKDEYTTLEETYDRVLATDVSARWRHDWTSERQPMPDWEKSYARAKRQLLEAFAETYSYSLQQTLYEMGSRVIGGRSGIDEIRLSLPNNHHFPVDLEPFGPANTTNGTTTNDGTINDGSRSAVYFAADRPYGLIEATVLRDGAEAAIPADLTNL
ncbi:factor-independent urate hydroxylase [Streptomyces sp. NPDC003691]